jgi:hypothetical protein
VIEGQSNGLPAPNPLPEGEDDRQREQDEHLTVGRLRRDEIPERGCADQHVRKIENPSLARSKPRALNLE